MGTLTRRPVKLGSLLLAGLMSGAFGVGIALAVSAFTGRSVDPGLLFRTTVLAFAVVIPATLFARRRGGGDSGAGH